MHCLGLELEALLVFGVRIGIRIKSCGLNPGLGFLGLAYRVQGMA